MNRRIDMLIEQVVMKCFMKLSSNRSDTAVYHLIAGKKSIQTIQDAKLFHLDELYGIYRSFKKERFYQIIQTCEANHWLQYIGKHKEQDLYTITEKGKIWLDNQDNVLLSYYNGKKYEKYDELFLKRLYLFIQTLSNTALKAFNFIPVVDDLDITNWVKQVYASAKGQEKSILQHLYNEIVVLLHDFNEAHAHIFVDRLTGHQRYGQSISQLSELYHYEEEDIYLILIAMVHKMFRLIEKSPQDYPMMSSLIPEQKEKLTLSKSAMSTYQLIKKGLDLQQIEKARHLKLNTIYDHVVEIAINDRDFPIDTYVSDQVYEEVMHVFKSSEHVRLKDIKESVNPDITYFQIRLVLAKSNH